MDTGCMARNNKSGNALRKARFKIVEEKKGKHHEEDEHQGAPIPGQKKENLLEGGERRTLIRFPIAREL